MITGKQLKEWACMLKDDALVGIDGSGIIAREQDSRGWEDTLEVGDLLCVDDMDEKPPGRR